VVSVLEDTRHGLDNGDVITLSDVEGMTQVRRRRRSEEGGYIP